MKLLIAVMSCQRDKDLGYHDVIRQRWGGRLSSVADVRFFVGGQHRSDLLADEVWLDVPDDYENLVSKSLGICGWVVENGYDYLFKCDCDTSIHVNRFKRYNYSRIDYAGRFWGGNPGDRGLYAAGTGYFLSKAACEVVLTYQGPLGSFEDVMVGNTLEPHIVSGGIRAEHIEQSIYAAIKGAGGGAVHGPAPECVLVRRRDDGMIVPRFKSLVLPGDEVLPEEP